MIFSERRFELDGKEIILRSATDEDAQMLADYINTVTGETRFLMREADEMVVTVEGELDFIRKHNDSESAMLILAFVDGKHAGNCSFEKESGSRRKHHRAEIGIALYLKYTGFGLGRLMLEQMLEVIKEQGFEQAELTVVGNNYRAYHLYETFGFKECGRIPNANKYDDGTYADDVIMVKSFQK